MENLGCLTRATVARTLGSGAIIYTSTILQGTELPKMASLALFSAYKNVGLAAAVVLIIFSYQAAMPSAVYILARNGGLRLPGSPAQVQQVYMSRDRRLD